MNNFFPFRHSRDELIQIAPHLIPDPLPDVPVRPENYIDVLSTGNLSVGTVESGEKASIFIDMSQRGVIYQLFTEEGEEMGEPVIGNCKEIELETTELQQKENQEWYEFYVVATHPSTGVSVRLNTDIWINAGQNDGVDPRPKSLKIKWNTPFELLIPDSQPNLTWKLRHGDQSPASPEVVSPAEGGDVNLVSTPLTENESLVIRVKNNETEKEKDLSQVQRVKVFPNPNLTFQLAPGAFYAEYAGTIQIEVSFPQSTVSYQLVEKIAENEYRPSGDPKVGEGTAIILTSGPLYDITTLRVLATKLRDDLEDKTAVELELDLFEYLNGELEVLVEPDPTIAVVPEKQIIPYNSSALITLPQPQPETTYYLHCGDKVAVSDVVHSDGSPVTLTTKVLQEDCSFFIRATRREISKDLYTQPQILVEPNYDLFVQLPETYFRRVDGTRILVHDAQTSVSYELYKQPAQFGETFSEAFLCDTRQGNAGLLELHTGALPADQYKFFVLAKKPEREGQLVQTVTLEVSVRRDIAVRTGPLALDYEGTTWLEFIDRQEFVHYRIVNVRMAALSDTLPLDDNSDRLDTYPLREDTRLFVHADHSLTDVEGLLDFEVEALVRPNANIQVEVPQPSVEYGEEAALEFSDGQKSVTYRVTGLPRTDALIWPPAMTQEFSPEQDGPFRMRFGPVQWPLRLSIVAIKTVNRMEVALASILEVNPYPKRNQEVKVHKHPASFGSPGTVEVEGIDWNTSYQLIREDNSPEGFSSTLSSPRKVFLNSKALYEDLRLYVRATGNMTGLEATLNQSVHLHVPPNLNLVPELVELPFRVRDGASIRIADTQASAEYRLEIKEYEEDRYGPGYTLHDVDFTQYRSGGGDIILGTGKLEHLRYEVRVQVKKKHSGLQGFLPKTISFFAGVMERNEVDIDQSVLEYGDSTRVTVSNPQPLASYQLYSEKGHALSEPVNTAAQGLGSIVLDSFPIYEDDKIEVRVKNLISDAVGTLKEKKYVLVYPNTDLNPVLEIAETGYDGYGLLRLSQAQKSVRYELIRQSVDEPIVPSHLQIGVVIERKSPSVDGEMNFAIGPMKIDQTFTLSAVKIDSGLRKDFSEQFSVFVGPSTDVDVRYDKRRLDWGESLEIFLRDSQPGVKYQLRDVSAPDGEGYVPEVVCNHFDAPVGKAIVGVDLVICNGGEDYLLMRTPPITEDITYEIEATKTRTGLKAILRERVEIKVKKGRGR